MRRNLNSASACAAAAAFAAAALWPGAPTSAVEVQWKGGNGSIVDNNYTVDGSVTTPATASGDILNLGANSTITLNTNVGVNRGRLRIGHNFTKFTPDNGTTSTLVGSSSLTTTTGTISMGGNQNLGVLGAGIVIGFNAIGELNVQGGIVQSTQSILIGVDDPNDTVTGTGTGTANVTGGSLRAIANDIRIGVGLPGVVNVSGGGQVYALARTDQPNQAGNPDLYIGYNTASQYNQTGGKTNVANTLYIGSGSTVDFAAGEILTKLKVKPTWAVEAPDGNLVVGRQGSSNDFLKIRNTAIVTVGGRFLLGSGGAGGNNSVVEQSGGTVTVATNLAVADTGGTAIYKLSGGTLTFNSELSRVGRRGNGTMLQSGGTATFNAGVAIGEDANAAAGETDNATGLYEISNGSLIANLAGNALRVGSAGNGTLRVVGQDGVVDVNGNFLLGNTSDGVGKLEYQFQSGESLSQIDVSGSATLAFNTGLAMDSSAAAPTQNTYNLLTAADVVDSGLLVSSPGWTYQIVTGGNGEILQAIKTTPQYWDTNGAVPGAGGGGTPTGSWDGTSANFSTDSTGGSGTGAVTGFADDVVFAAGADATGTYNVTVVGTQTANSVQFTRGGATLTGGTVAAGKFDVAAGITGTIASTVTGDAFGRVIKSGPGTLVLTGVNAYTGGTTVNAGTLVVKRLHENNAVTINAGTLKVSESSPTFPNHPAGDDAAVSQPASLTIASGATLDLGNNDLILAYGAGTAYNGTSPVAALEALIAQGFGANQDWTGTGITSSTAASEDAAGNYVIAIADNALLPQAFGASNGGENFDGVDVPLESVLIKFTHRVDLNLDGLVNGDDAQIFSTNYDNGSPAYWSIGDLDYNGVFNSDDVQLFATYYDNTLQHLPEPGSMLGLFSVAWAAFSRRLRRSDQVQA